MRGRKQSKHRLKPLLFDPGGYRLNGVHHWILPTEPTARKRSGMVELIWDRRFNTNYNSGAVDGGSLFHPCLKQFASTMIWCCHLDEVYCLANRYENSHRISNHKYVAFEFWKFNLSPAPRGGMLRMLALRFVLSGPGNPKTKVSRI